MKKLISMILILTMALVLFSSCADTKKDWEYIESKGTLKIGVTIFKPMNYTDDDGNWTGFETEFAEKVTEKLGVKAEFVKIVWDKKVVELKSKAIDCIWNGMTVTDELKAEMDMSQSYMNNWQVARYQKSRCREIYYPRVNGRCKNSSRSEVGRGESHRSG